MTWPFENDTSGIVKRISNRSISANRKRNIFIVLTIALASALLSAIVLYGFGVMQETQNRNQKTAQIMYHAISEQQGQELYKQEEIAWVGEFFNAFSEQVNHSTVNFTYPYFYYSFPWLIVLIYLAILLIVQFTLISYTTGNLKKQSLVEQIRAME